MAPSTSTAPAAVTDRGPARTPAIEPFSPDGAGHAGARAVDHPHPMSGREPIGALNRVAVSGSGAP